MEQFAQYNDFVPTEELVNLQGFFQENVFWKFGWQSNKNHADAPFSHWNHDFLATSNTNQDDCSDKLLSDPALTPIADLWKRLQLEKLSNHALVRCYANAHTFGVEGYPHTDSRKPGNYTTVIYINPQWKPEWAGETVFINDLGDIAYAVLPRPGRAVIFDGRIVHSARAVTRLCPALRVTLMFKTRAPSAEDDGNANA
jgi:Rps23 Pro-64 3,4-dihydroxylase Tpa1-like proline 4-hydroxylase